jgi:O-antigen/teichoic acid export membrane protein
MVGKKIGINFFISALARVFGFFVSYFITLRLITGYLKEQGFGQYSTAFAFTYFFSFFADLGLYSLMVRDISRPEADEKKVASDIFSLRLFSITISLLIAALTSVFIPYSPEVKIAIVLSTLFYFFSSLSQVIMGIFQKYLKVWRAAIAEIISRIVGVLAVWAVIVFNLGVFGVAFATSLSALVNFALLFPMAKRLIPFSISFDFKKFKGILKQTWPIGLSIIFTVVYFKIDTILLSFYRSYQEVGIYNLSYKLFEGLIFFPAMFVGLIMPILSKYALNLKEKFLEYFKKSLHLILISVFPLIIVLF